MNGRERMHQFVLGTAILGAMLGSPEKAIAQDVGMAAPTYAEQLSATPVTPRVPDRIRGCMPDGKQLGPLKSRIEMCMQLLAPDGSIIDTYFVKHGEESKTPPWFPMSSNRSHKNGVKHHIETP